MGGLSALASAVSGVGVSRIVVSVRALGSGRQAATGTQRNVNKGPAQTTSCPCNGNAKTIHQEWPNSSSPGTARNAPVSIAVVGISVSAHGNRIACVRPRAVIGIPWGIGPVRRRIGVIRTIVVRIVARAVGIGPWIWPRVTVAIGIKRPAESASIKTPPNSVMTTIAVSATVAQGKRKSRSAKTTPSKSVRAAMSRKLHCCLLGFRLVNGRGSVDRWRREEFALCEETRSDERKRSHNQITVWSVPHDRDSSSKASALHLSGWCCRTIPTPIDTTPPRIAESSADLFSGTREITGGPTVAEPLIRQFRLEWSL